MKLHHCKSCISNGVVNTILRGGGPARNICYQGERHLSQLISSVSESQKCALLNAELTIAGIRDMSSFTFRSSYDCRNNRLEVSLCCRFFGLYIFLIALRLCTFAVAQRKHILRCFLTIIPTFIILV